jgi:hypothetical protein
MQAGTIQREGAKTQSRKGDFKKLLVERRRRPVLFAADRFGHKFSAPLLLCVFALNLDRVISVGNNA